MPVMLNGYLKNKYGCKVYKLALNANVTCPNRDGKIGDRGCIFCSAGGAGDFAPYKMKSIDEQIKEAKERVSLKIKDGKYIAYFQSFTNTYGPIDYLEKIFTEAINKEDIVGLSIATRPDCIDNEVLDLIEKLNKIKPVWIELGLQSVNSKTIEYIRRGYDMSCFEDTQNKLKERNIETVIHLILGLPGESEEDMLRSVEYVAKSGAQGIKLHLLHILKGTDLEKEYEQGKIRVLGLDEYVELLNKCISLLPKDMVIHRLTGDGPKNLLIAPEWSKNKKNVLNKINRGVKGITYL